MRIVCESCGTKYSISDEKVRGKLFKIRCKKCSHVIVVRGAQDELPADEAETVRGYGDLPRESEAPVDESASYEWFYVVDGQQAGPVGPDEVGSYVAAGEIHADTYMWRDGMDDWVHLSAIPEFAQLVEEAVGAVAASDRVSLDVPAVTDRGRFAPAETPRRADREDRGGPVHAGAAMAGADDYDDDDEATKVMAKDSGDEVEATEPGPSPMALFSAEEHTTPQRSSSEGVFGRSQPESRGREAYAARHDYDDDLTAPLEAESSGGGLFSAGAFSAASLEGGAVEQSQSELVGARSENSVLFSLDTLAGIDSASEQDNGSGLPTTEGSGLIDIKALAASQAAAGPDTRFPSDEAPIVTPAVMPIGHRQSHKLLYGLMATGVVIIIGLVVAIVLVFTSRQPTEAQTQQAMVPTAAEQQTPQATPGPQPGATGPVAVTTPEQPIPPPAPVGPPTEHVVAATQAGTLVGAFVATQKATSAAQAIADRPTRVASRERSSRDSDRSSRRDRDTQRTSRDDDAEEERSSSRSSRRDRDEERPSSSQSEDPVDRALGRIQRSDRDEQEQERESSTSSRSDDREEARSDLPEQLSRSQVSQTIRRYGRRIGECRQRSDVPSGEVLEIAVEMTVQGNGRVASARTSSSDPAAPCFVDVVRDMRFDEFSGEAMTFTYPFRVR